MHISLAAEPLFTFLGITVTNSLLASLMVSVLLISAALILSKNIEGKPSRAQAVIEEIFSFIIDIAESAGGKEARRFVPLVLTFFFYILFSNWIGLLPGFGSIVIEKTVHGHHEVIPVFRGATADLNTTLALALVSVFAIQYYGIASAKMEYFKRFFNFSNAISFFTGILELFSDVAKLISFSFRLFGNIFAGEVLLAVVVGLIPYIAPLPFFGLEIFVGFIQSLVFAVLTLVFIQTAASEHAEELAYEKSEDIGEMKLGRESSKIKRKEVLNGN